MRLRAAEDQRLAEAQAQEEAERAASEAERAAREAEEAARFHESAARRATVARQQQSTAIDEEARQRAVRHANEMSRIAAAERIEAVRRAEAVAIAEASARRESMEMEEARASAARQAARYQESGVKLRSASSPGLSSASMKAIIGGEISDPYSNSSKHNVRPGRIYHQPSVPDGEGRQSRSRERVIITPVDPLNPGDVDREYLGIGSLEEDARIAAHGAAALEAAAQRHSGVIERYTPPPAVKPSQQSSRSHRAVTAQGSSPLVPTSRPESFPPVARTPSSAALPVARPSGMEARPSAAEIRAASEAWRADSAALRAASRERQEVSSGFGLPVAEPFVEERPRVAEPVRRPYRGYQPDESSGFFPAAGSAKAKGPAPAAEKPVVPAWIGESSSALEPAPVSRRVPSASGSVVTASGSMPTADTLQHSRERVAARWYALKGLFDHAAQEPPVEREAPQAAPRQAPILGVFSLAGGVGKTSLVATLGRALSSTGEKVLLTDTTSHGLLPFYFGASGLRPGVVRAFSPPAGSADATICLVSYDVLQRSGDLASQDWLAQELTARSEGMARVLVDLSSTTPWVARRLVKMNATILVPLAPDMNSVISLGAIEKFFAEMRDAAGKQVEPCYLLNQFDATLPLHLDVREVLRQQLGDRLLPFCVRRASAVPESLAEGMTVMDYAPESAVAEDFRHLAQWLKARVAPATAAQHTARWSER
ncbi:MAG: cellulose synthase operon protein YhjQ/BcsQ [Acidobacteriaceae bacterium]|nr:cellulose synthase operon protein YhjQ/BcsQ [Acidobacteriaceae bacterium]